MLKSSIIDTSVRIIPSKDFISFIKLQIKNNSTSVPTNIQKVIGWNKIKERQESSHDPIKFTDDEKIALKELNHANSCRTPEKSENESPSDVESIHEPLEQVKDMPIEPEITENHVVETRPCLYNSDLKWVFNLLQERRKTDPDIPYLNELLQGSELILPENHYVERNPVLEERCKKLRKEQEQREYDKMTKNVDTVRKRNPDDSIGYQSEFFLIF